MVTNEQRVKTLFAQANPIPDADLFDLDEIGGTAYLATLETRSSEMTQLDTKGQNQKEKKTATPWLIAAAVAIVAGIGLIVVNQGNEAPLIGQLNAEASVNAWFDAYNAGNDEAVLELFAPGVVISDSIAGSSTLDEWTMLLAWNTAQGSVWTPQECSADEIDPGVSFTVTCSTGHRDAPTQAVDSPPVPTNLVAVVTADGISEITFGYGALDFTYVGGPSTVWMVANHPEIVEAGTIAFGNWDTVEEARANGLLTAQYAAEWATYLTENDCTFLDGC